MCLRFFKKISPKTFGLHCVFQARRSQRILELKNSDESDEYPTLWMPYTVRLSFISIIVCVCFPVTQLQLQQSNSANFSSHLGAMDPNMDVNKFTFQNRRSDLTKALSDDVRHSDSSRRTKNWRCYSMQCRNMYTLGGDSRRLFTILPANM
jgi:hypothetical protein